MKLFYGFLWGHFPIEFWVAAFISHLYISITFCYCKNWADSFSQFCVVLEQAECCFLATTSFLSFIPQVLVRNVPPDMDESVSEHIEHFFCVNHPDHYLMHQVCWSLSVILFRFPFTNWRLSVMNLELALFLWFLVV